MLKTEKLKDCFGNKHKYGNHHKCKFPTDGIDYCWSWATIIDDNKDINNFIDSVCMLCEYYKLEKKEYQKLYNKILSLRGKIAELEEENRQIKTKRIFKKK